MIMGVKSTVENKKFKKQIYFFFLYSHLKFTLTFYLC